MPGGAIVKGMRRVLNARGFDIVRYPHWNSVPWALQNLLPQLGVTCVLDVGAHYGEFGGMLREVGYTGHIVSFEPVAESFRRLEARAGDDPRWTVHPWALGAEQGSLPLHVTDGDVFSSFLESASGAGGAYAQELQVRETREVPVRRLDQVLDEVTRHITNPRFFLKSDTQGYDFHVLEGAGARIEELQGLQVELALQPLYRGMRGFTESLESLNGMGFELYCLSPITHDDTLRVIEYDCIMRRARG